MAEMPRQLTQAEIDRILFNQRMGMQPTPPSIQDLRQGISGTVTSIPDNFFQRAATGARAAGQFVNKAGTAADIAKLFPGYTGQSKVNIPTGFNFGPKQDPMGGVIPGGLQTQQLNVDQLLKAIKPADVLGLTGAQQAYTDVGMGKAPNPMDVLDVAGLGAVGYGAGRGLLKVGKNAPVGLSIQDAPGLLQTAPKSDIGFYSAVEQAAIASPRKSGAGQAFLNDIMKGENVKADEIKWMGLDEFLKGKQNVTKQEVQDYIANNRVNVQEVQLGGAQPYDANRLAQLQSEYRTLKQHPLDDPSFGEDKYNEFIRLMNIRDQSTTQSLYDAADRVTKSGQLAQRRGDNVLAEKYFREAELLNTRAEKLDLEGQGLSNPTKFGQYTLPGGENYRELLLTMPSKKVPAGWTAKDQGGGMWVVFDETGAQRGSVYDARNSSEAIAQKASKFSGEQYISSHFPDQKNILAHLRVNDRIDADGKKMLLIEEVQSDWHQAGREKGYKSTSGLTQAQISEKQQEIFRRFDAGEITREQRNAEIDSLNAAKENLQGVPDAPFKDNWYQLALKRAIQHAAENGYDRIGLTTGSQQAARFDLSKQISELHYSGTNLVAYDKGGNQVIQKTGVSEADLPGLIGKEAAKKLIEQPKQGTLRSLVGQELQVGGEGMKKYYDEIYPKFLDKYGKKWGARVGETKIRTSNSKMVSPEQVQGWDLGGVSPEEFVRQYNFKDGETIRYLDITPEMKTGVSKGQPLFQAAPVIGTGLLGSQQEDR